MSQSQEFTFQTEIKQLLHILSHSLYQNREIALRELISNASDSLNKLRHLQLAEKQWRDENPLEVTLQPHKEARILVIQDNGVGLTQEELIQNLGTIAHSGSKEFFQNLVSSGKGDGSPDLSLIGQFGVGFYSAFMLADKVEVVTRSYRETTGWRWESDGSGRYSITAAGDEVPRGAQIQLHLKEQLEEFLDPNRLKHIVRRYSTFVPFPILLEGAVLNEQKPIWVEPKSQVSDDQHNAFYQWLTHRTEEQPLWRLHLSSDSPIQFHAILYCPPTNFELLGFGENQHGLNLCAKRILVQDDCRDLLPDYLRFLYGVVDSADLPLNVSRETLQDHRLLPKLKKVLTRKVLDHLASLATEDAAAFQTFTRQFGSILRTGIGQDFENRERIAKLMRFQSTQTVGSGLELPESNEFRRTSLDEYLSRAAVGQEQIYYLAGTQVDAMSRHPHLEAFRKRGLEVLFLDDPVDEFALTQLRSFEGKDLISIDSADVRFPESTNPTVESEKPQAPGNFTRVLELFRGALDKRVADVRLSERLTDSTCCLVNSEGTMSSQLQKVLSTTMKGFEMSKRVFEVNPHARLTERLCELAGNPENDEFIRDCGRQLYSDALLLDGLIPDAEEVTNRSLRFMEELSRTRSVIVT